MIKFKKMTTPNGKYFMSECGEYKIVNYNGKIFMFYKNGYSIEYDRYGNSVNYKTYRQAMTVLSIVIKRTKEIENRIKGAKCRVKFLKIILDFVNGI